MAQGRSTEIISMIKWIQTSRLSIKNSLSLTNLQRPNASLQDITALSLSLSLPLSLSLYPPLSLSPSLSLTLSLHGKRRAHVGPAPPTLSDARS